MGQSWVPFSRYITNTVVITLVGTLGHLLIASLAAYVLAKYDFPLGKQFFALVVTALMFNGYVTAIPNYLTMTRLNLVDTHWGGHPARVRRADRAVPDEAVHGRAAHVAD